MKKIGKVLLLLIGTIFFDGCTKNIEPIPDNVKFNTSFSLPVGVGEVSLTKTLQTLGVPIYNLDEDVPEWFTYKTVYYADTLPLNLTEVTKMQSI